MTRFRPLHLFILVLGLSFLYLPIVILIIYSFNDSRLVTVWGGFSLRWYAALFSDENMLDAAWTTLRVALMSASLATIIGLVLAHILARPVFKGKTLVSALAFAPLVLPEVIMGLSLLLLFVALDVERGYWTLVFAHVSFTAAFATVIIHAQLVGLDRNLIEAALDLGCPPCKSFFLVTLPLIATSIMAAWLLAFTLSMDDLVVASFTTGPGATTLPMRIYSQVRLGVSPEINALSTLFVAFVALIVLSFSLLTKGRALRLKV